MKKYDCIVVGAGNGGLAAAIKILDELGVSNLVEWIQVKNAYRLISKDIKPKSVAISAK